MKVGLYCVLDSVSGVYDGPVPAQNDGVALRNFQAMAQNDQSPIGRNPADFSLWRVGEWNDGLGEITIEPKKKLAFAIDLLKPTEEN